MDRNRFPKHVLTTDYCLLSTTRRASRSGQSIAEVLVAVTVGAVLVGAAASLILPSLRSNTQVTNIQAGTTIAKGMLDNVRVFSEGNWNNVLALATGSASIYFLQTAKSPFVAASGTEAIPYDGITSGLVGWWKFDDGVGSTTVDSSGNGSVGTWNGTPIGTAGTYYVPGQVGQYAGDFDGSTDSVNAGNGGALNTAGAITVGTWVKFNGLDYVGNTGKLITIAAKGSPDTSPGTPSSGWWFSYDNRTNKNSFGFTCFGNSAGGFAGGGNNFPYNYTFSNNVWYYVAFTVDQFGKANLYVNGAQLGATKSFVNLVLSNTTNNLVVGNNIIYYMNGGIDDVRVYNRALSSGEITQIYSDTYKRYFYLNDVYRTSSGTITSGGGSYDPSTKQVVVGYSWPGSATQTLSTYLTRNGNKVLDQTDWSGGVAPGGTVTTTTNSQFATSSNIDFSTKTGSFSLPIAGSGSSFNGYTYKRAITVTPSMVSSTLTSFPMLFAGTYGYLAASSSPGGTLQSPYDYVFTSDSGCTSNLNFEQESYVSSTGAVADWVQIPSLTSSTVIYLCYDNAAIASSQQNVTVVWDANYKGVWHLPNGTSLTANDSTSNGKNGTINGGVSSTVGQVDGGGLFDGTTGYINAPAVSSSALTAFTVSAWVKPNGLQTAGSSVVSDLYSTVVNYALYFDQASPPSLRLFAGYYTSGAWHQAPMTTLTDGVWAYVVLTYDGSTVKLYINNNASLNTVDATVPTSNNLGFRIGRRWDLADNVKGIIDEVRISSIARTSDWVKTEYNNQSNPAAFYTVGAP